jgi:hypothetical protein
VQNLRYASFAANYGLFLGFLEAWWAFNNIDKELGESQEAESVGGAGEE